MTANVVRRFRTRAGSHAGQSMYPPRATTGPCGSRSTGLGNTSLDMPDATLRTWGGGEAGASADRAPQSAARAGSPDLAPRPRNVIDEEYLRLHVGPAHGVRVACPPPLFWGLRWGGHAAYRSDSHVRLDCPMDHLPLPSFRSITSRTLRVSDAGVSGF